MSSTKLKIKKFVHSVNLFEVLFPGSSKVLQITLKLSCTFKMHVNLHLASSVINVNYKIRKIHWNICKD